MHRKKHFRKAFRRLRFDDIIWKSNNVTQNY